MRAKHWYDYLWVYAIIYFALGFFNILFAWLGMIDFLLPLFLSQSAPDDPAAGILCGKRDPCAGGDTTPYNRYGLLGKP